MNTSKPSLEQATELDRCDSLAAKRDEFLIPAGTIYLNGNSLGPLTLHAQHRAQQVVKEQWGDDLIASWNRHDWIDLPITTAEKIAKLVGAGPGQLVCCDSVSINLLKLLACCMQMQASRNIVLSQRDNFPTDLYVAQGLEALLGSARCKLRMVDSEELISAMQDDVAVLILTEVNFRSGERHDMERLTSLARERDILVIWDLSHSVGVMPLQLDDWDVDFAVGCGYKYLNGGPGSPAFIYANQKHHAALEQPIQGWMGHAEPFAFDPQYRSAQGMAQFLVGTPPILSMSVLDAALDTFADVSMPTAQAKAVTLSELFRELLLNEEELEGFELISPADAMRRGAHLAYSHPRAYSICRAMNAAGLVVDFRSPDIIRFGFSPLFLRHQDIWRAIQILRKIMVEESYLRDEFSQSLKVT